MTRPSLIALAILALLLAASDFVSSSPGQEAPVTATTQHLDPHVGYYQQHLLNIGALAPNR